MSIANDYTPDDIAEMTRNVIQEKGDYLSDLLNLADLALIARRTLSVAETTRLDYLSAYSETLGQLESDEYMTLYKRAHGE